jgi:hypothetical protein
LVGSVGVLSVNLFIDTNIFLSFFYLTSDDLEELKKLGVLLEQKNVSLFLPDQVIDEFKRNREYKIADTIKRLREQKLNLQFPQICKDYYEYFILRALQKNYEEQHSNLISKINEHVSGQNLKADNLISELFEKAKKIQSTDDLIERARLRVDINNPPGKKGSLGDAIIWECLLEHIPVDENIYFVTDDKDFVSVLDENSLKKFLIQEWADKKRSQIIYYKRLSSFFKEHFPEIKMASELEKEILIRNLSSSSSFANTHIVIAKLSQCSEFTQPQRNEIVESAISNNQVYLIISDPDVNTFLESIISGHEDEIDQESLDALQGLLWEGDGSEEIP